MQAWLKADEGQQMLVISYSSTGKTRYIRQSDLKEAVYKARKVSSISFCVHVTVCGRNSHQEKKEEVLIESCTDVPVDGCKANVYLSLSLSPFLSITVFALTAQVIPRGSRGRHPVRDQVPPRHAHLLHHRLYAYPEWNRRPRGQRGPRGASGGQSQSMTCIEWRHMQVPLCVLQNRILRRSGPMCRETREMNQRGFRPSGM